MDPIAIVIPTLNRQQAIRTGRLALIAALCPARLIISDGPKRGFTKTVNDGMKQAEDNEDVCLLNDDVLWFQYGWLRILRRALYSRGNYGIVGPSGGSSTAPMRDAPQGLQGLEVVGHLPFWCVLIKRKVIARLGLLDEAFIHYASDNWYCDQLIKAGMKSVWVRDVFLMHRHHGSGLIEKWRLYDQGIYAKRCRNRRK